MIKLILRFIVIVLILVIMAMLISNCTPQQKIVRENEQKKMVKYNKHKVAPFR